MSYLTILPGTRLILTTLVSDGRHDAADLWYEEGPSSGVVSLEEAIAQMRVAAVEQGDVEIGAVCFDVTDDVRGLLCHEVRVAEGVTVRDVLRLLGPEVDFFDATLGHGCREFVRAAMRRSPKPVRALAHVMLRTQPRYEGRAGGAIALETPLHPELVGFDPFEGDEYALDDVATDAILDSVLHLAESSRVNVGTTTIRVGSRFLLVQLLLGLLHELSLPGSPELRDAKVGILRAQARDATRSTAKPTRH